MRSSDDGRRGRTSCGSSAGPGRGARSRKKVCHTGPPFLRGTPMIPRLTPQREMGVPVFKKATPEKICPGFRGKPFCACRGIHVAIHVAGAGCGGVVSHAVAGCRPSPPVASAVLGAQMARTRREHRTHDRARGAETGFCGVWRGGVASSHVRGARRAWRGVCARRALCVVRGGVWGGVRGVWRAHVARLGGCRRVRAKRATFAVPILRCDGVLFTAEWQALIQT